MNSYFAAWDPSNHNVWATLLGLVPVPLFGHRRIENESTTSTVLLDGRVSSFAICSSNDSDKLLDESLSWAWSSNLNHALIIDDSRSMMYLRRWDMPDTIRRFQLPSRAKGAEDLLKLIESAPTPPPGVDVIGHILRAFRQLRANLPNNDALESIRVFNALLAGAECVILGTIDENDWLACRTIENIISILNLEITEQSEIMEIGNNIRQTEVGDLLLSFLKSNFDTGIRLEPDLLLRHASGHLYQEAHIILDREQPQLSLPGMANGERLHGMQKRDAHYTPSSLARSLTQEAFEALRHRINESTTVEILDPACGSGVFLLEALRELQSLNYRGRVLLRGFDISAVSCSMARFCLLRARNDAITTGMSVDVIIQNQDSLTENWGSPDLILMNPPFVPWQDLSEGDREAVSIALGDAYYGRIDKAMAFVSKGAASLVEGGVIASVLPAAILESRSGFDWRESLTDIAALRLIGRFRGYGYFRGSAVEPAFIILQRKENILVANQPIKMLIASEGSEDKAIRALRRYTDDRAIPSTSQEWEILNVPSDAISSSSWLPRSGKYQQLIAQLTANRLTHVGDLFDIHQGIRTGNNGVFILSEIEYKSLPRIERKFFRAIASNTTINNCSIHKGRYVFYPYDDAGLLLRKEEELNQFVPTYYNTRLLPEKTALQDRSRIPQDCWWKLTHERTWQWRNSQKIVSKYFGDSGGFAYDNSGEYVVVQGFAWFWKSTEGVDKEEFYASELPWAYLSILNSKLFEMLLDGFCPRVQGGQFDLSPRFINQVFLPNLDNSRYIMGNDIRILAEYGRCHNQDSNMQDSELNECVARVYGICNDLWNKLI